MRLYAVTWFSFTMKVGEVSIKILSEFFLNFFESECEFFSNIFRFSKYLRLQEPEQFIGILLLILRKV